MTLVVQIDDDIKTAMKAQDADRLSVLRMVKAALKNKSIDIGSELDDAAAITVIQKEAKLRTDAAIEFRRGNREDLATKEEAEATMLAVYLPVQLDDAALGLLVEAALQDTGASSPADMGKVIGLIKAKAGGSADGGRIAALVKEKLGA